MSHEPSRLSPKRWARGVLIGLDQFAGTFVGMDPDETISSASGRAAKAGHRWAKVLCWMLDKVDPGHCEKSIEEGRHFPDRK
jgi:hypothetical protein